MRNDQEVATRPVRLICITGIDGSDKTPLAHRLVQHLRERGYDARYVHGVLRRNLLLGPVRRLVRALFLRGTDVRTDYRHYRTVMVSASHRHALLSALYGAVWFLNYCLEAFFPITLPVLRGKIVVADRYIYDIILRIALATGRPVTGLSRLLALFFLTNAKPDLVFFVDTPAEIAFQRKPEVHSMEHLQERRDCYLLMAKSYRFHVLDGKDTLDELINEILAHCFESICLAAPAQ